MRVVINQPNYIPWRGYFDLIDDADLFLYHDDVQYTKQDWRNRNKIKTASGSVWLSVPVKKVSTETLIKDVLIDHEQKWLFDHKRRLTEAYKTTSFFRAYAEEFFAILDKKHEKLADLDIETAAFILRAFKIETPVSLVSMMELKGQKTEKLLAILRACGGSEYLSGPAAKAYIDEKKFEEAGIKLTWKTYDYAPYPQLWGDFEGAVTALDLLFNCGADARAFLKSR